jgi:hypothetical protein
MSSSLAFQQARLKAVVVGMTVVVAGALGSAQVVLAETSGKVVLQVITVVDVVVCMTVVYTEYIT